MESAEHDDLRAIVQPRRALQHFKLERWKPSQDLSRFVDRFWKTTWDLPEPFTQSVLGFPAVNMVVQSDGSTTVTGVLTETDSRTLDGSGWALGVMFRPAGFRPFVEQPMTQLTDQRRDASAVFGPAAHRLAEAVVNADSDNDRCLLLDAFFRLRMPDEPTEGERLSGLVEQAATGELPTTRASELASQYGASVRTLQRLFAEHVGVAPKFVLDRYRRQHAAEAARSGVDSWAELAQRIGYADQAHLTKDFSATFGLPPAAYASGESIAE